MGQGLNHGHGHGQVRGKVRAMAIASGFGLRVWVRKYVYSGLRGLLRDPRQPCLEDGHLAHLR